MRMLREDVDRPVGAPTEHVAVITQLRHVAHDRVAADQTLAVHVAGERDEPGFREKPRAAARMIVEAGTSVNNQNAGPLVAACRIDRKESIESGVFVTIGNRSGLERHWAPM